MGLFHNYLARGSLFLLQSVTPEGVSRETLTRGTARLEALCTRAPWFAPWVLAPWLAPLLQARLLAQGSQAPAPHTLPPASSQTPPTLIKYHFCILICTWYKNSRLANWFCVISCIPSLLDAFEINRFTLKQDVLWGQKNINEETYLIWRSNSYFELNRNTEKALYSKFSASIFSIKWPNKILKHKIIN